LRFSSQSTVNVAVRSRFKSNKLYQASRLAGQKPKTKNQTEINIRMVQFLNSIQIDTQLPKARSTIDDQPAKHQNTTHDLGAHTPTQLAATFHTARPPPKQQGKAHTNSHILHLICTQAVTVNRNNNNVRRTHLNSFISCYKTTSEGISGARDAGIHSNAAAGAATERSQ
jgi:hypothetical protein